MIPETFKIQSLFQEESENIAKLSRKTKKVNGKQQESLDATEFSRRMVLAATVEPDFSSTELCESLGVMDPLLVPASCCSQASLTSWSARLRSCPALTLWSLRKLQKTNRRGRPRSGRFNRILLLYQSGVAPSQYEALPYRERVLVAEFVQKEIRDRKKSKEA